MAPAHEIALRAIGTALAGLSGAFAIYMLAYAEGKTRVNGVEYLRIFAQPRGSAGARLAASTETPLASDKPVDLTATGSLPPPPIEAAPRPQIEIVAARVDRVWLKIDHAIRAAAPGEAVPGLGRIGAIVPRDGGWIVLDDKGAPLLSVAKGANGASMFSRNKIFE